MPIPITVPRLGWSMDEGTFVGWLRKQGESIKAGEPLFTLEGDKATQEVEAADSGMLHISMSAPEAGEPVSVGVVLGYLLGENESAADIERVAQPPAPKEEHELPAAAKTPGSVVIAPASAATAHPGSYTATVAISPRARRRAAELGLDYRHLKGSGRSGRITEADVLQAAKEGAVARPAGLSAMRRTIAQRTTESFSRAPHFYLRSEVDATALVELRQRLLPELEQAVGRRLTLTDLLLRAQAIALADCPFANAIWHDGQLVPLPARDVGLVVGVDGGLLVPIVRAPGVGSLAELLKQRASLVEAARAGKLSAEAMQGGATSLSNLGNTCADEFAAVISPPQSSMLAVGRVAARPFVVSGQISLRTTLRLCFSVDHRVMDGGPAAKFLGRVVQLIEDPSALILS